ncbi:MAG: TonB-dependent receptor [Hyphomonadaceae bacterium]|nr:TonB-dependent receptor [Hyphomonadaceae bacterium]
MTIRSTRLLAGAGFAAIFALAAPAFADDAGELVVTATRTPTESDRLPARVEVIDRADFESKGLVSLADALREAPGVTVVSTGAPGAQTSVFLRGANSKHALALFDGIRLNDPTAPNGQYDFGQDTLGDLERVEVLRGAASSVYGSDAIGGVVNLVPRRGAGKAFAPYFDVSAGSFETWRGVVGAAGSVGALSYGATVDAFSTEGFDQVPDRFVTHTGDKDGADIATFTGSMAYALTDALSLDALVRHRTARADFDTFSGGPFFSQRADDPDLEIDSDDYTVWRIGGSLKTGDFTTRLSGGQVLNERRERDGGVVTTTVEGERNFVDLETRWTRARIGFVSDPALTFGAQYATERTDNSSTLFTNALFAEEDNRALFAVGQGRLGKGTDVALSLRWDDNENFGDQTTYTLGVSQDFAAFNLPVRVYASWGASYKAPTLSERFGTNFFNVGNPDLQPEEGESAEIGFDATPFEALSFGATYFDTEIENLIEYDFGSLQNINIGRADIDGFETYVKGSLSDRANIRLSYVFTDARNASAAGNPRLARRAPHAWSVDGSVQVTEKLKLSAGWTWTSSRIDVLYDDNGDFAAGAGRNAGYDTGRLALDFAVTDALSLYAVARNISDTDYEDPNAFRGAPRSVSVGVRGTF